METEQKVKTKDEDEQKGEDIQQEKQEQQEHQNKELDQKIQFIVNQTSYTYETAKGMMEMFDGDYIKIIKMFHGINDKPEEKNTTINQEIFRQIRNKMQIN